MSAFDCKNFEDMIEEHRAGTLVGRDRELAEAHLALCARCRQSLRLWEGFMGSIDRMVPDPLPPLVERSIMVTAADTRPAPRGRRLSKGVTFAAGFAVAAAAAVTLVLTGVVGGAVPGGGVVEGAASATGSPAHAITRLEDGRLVVRLDEVTNLWVDDESDFRLDEATAGTVRVRLDKGKVVADIGPHAGAFRFVVSTPDGEVEAKGTIFAVEVAPAGGTITRVLRGLVEVRAAPGRGEGGRFTVGVGEKGAIGDAGPVETTRWETEGDFCLLRGCPALLDRGLATATVPEEALGQPAPAQAEPPPEPSPISQDSSSSRRSPRNEKPTLPDEAASEAHGDPAADLVARALGLRKRGDYEGAAATYRELIETCPRCVESQNALVSLGQLELANLGDPVAALERFRTYLERSPGGILAEEARLGKVRAFAAAGRPLNVIEASSDYLERHPGGYAGAEVILRRGDARRGTGDCAGALADYSQLKVWWPTAPEISRAERGIELCAGR